MDNNLTLELRRDLTEARQKIADADSDPNTTAEQRLELRERAHRLWQRLEEVEASTAKRG